MITLLYYCFADGEKKGRFRRRSGDGTDLGVSLYSYPAGTTAKTLAQYKVRTSVRCVLPFWLPVELPATGQKGHCFLYRFSNQISRARRLFFYKNQPWVFRGIPCGFRWLPSNFHRRRDNRVDWKVPRVLRYFMQFYGISWKFVNTHMNSFGGLFNTG